MKRQLSEDVAVVEVAVGAAQAAVEAVRADPRQVARLP